MTAARSGDSGRNSVGGRQGVAFAEREVARGFKALAGMRCVSAAVLPVVNWDQEKSESQYRDDLRSEAWEVVVPELVLEPDA